MRSNGDTPLSTCSAGGFMGFGRVRRQVTQGGLSEILVFSLVSSKGFFQHTDISRSGDVLARH